MTDNPWCCAGDKLRISVEGFDQGSLTSLQSVRFAVKTLPASQALEIIDYLIEHLESK